MLRERKGTQAVDQHRHSSPVLQEQVGKKMSQSHKDRLIMNFVMGDMQCFSAVENEQFRRLVNTMQLSATVMNRKSLVNKIENLYKEHEASLITTLGKTSIVCCTTDCWIASNR